MQYSDKVMDHFMSPRNVGEIEDASGVGEVGNAKCGDIMRIYLDIEEETKIIKDVKFKTFGCGSAIASSSMATEMVKGKTIHEALEVTNKAVAEALDGLPPVKMHCSGCGSAIASSSMATEMVKGKTIHEALEVTNKAVAEALDGLPPVKMHCSVLAEQAIKAALIDYAKKHNVHIPELDGVVIDDDHDHHHDVEEDEE